MLWKSLLVLTLTLSTSFNARAESLSAAQSPVVIQDEESGIEDLNPFAANIGEHLKELEGESIPVEEQVFSRLTVAGCYQVSCPIYVDVDKSTQTARLYLDGRLDDQWDVSTGMAGFGTPNFNKRFNGRIFDRYTSSKYPGGDYNGLGNMPYAMFIAGGIAIHGTPRGNWSRLGRPASHGCIRSHPDKAYRLNRLLRSYGVQNSWVTVR